MWRVARSIADELRGLETTAQEALGFGLDTITQDWSLGARQAIFITSTGSSAESLKRQAC